MAVAYGSILGQHGKRRLRAAPAARQKQVACACSAPSCDMASCERRRSPHHRRRHRGVKRGGSPRRRRPVTVVVHEAASFAGGRCRSYPDPTLGLVIDNGNHLLLSGNHEALDYLDRIGARETLHDPGAATFDFADLKSGERWRLDLSEGRVPWWLFDPEETRARHGAWPIFRSARRVHEGTERDGGRRYGLRAAPFTSGSGAPC